MNKLTKLNIRNWNLSNTNSVQSLYTIFIYGPIRKCIEAELGDSQTHPNLPIIYDFPGGGHFQYPGEMKKIQVKFEKPIYKGVKEIPESSGIPVLEGSN